jgi:hypothetical protein
MTKIQLEKEHLEEVENSYLLRIKKEKDSKKQLIKSLFLQLREIKNEDDLQFKRALIFSFKQFLNSLIFSKDTEIINKSKFFKILYSLYTEKITNDLKTKLTKKTKGNNMFNMRELKNTIKNSNIYDTKFEFRNLDYEELLDKAVGQHLLILDYEKGILDKICQISELEKKIENLEQSIMVQTYKN